MSDIRISRMKCALKASPTMRASISSNVLIDASQVASLQRTDTKLLAHPPFLERLREQGKVRATAWLAEHFDALGHRSTVDGKKFFA